MSSCPSSELDENLVREFYTQELTAEEVALVLKAWKPYRAEIEQTLEQYWDTDAGDGPASWRDWRDTAFDYLPDPFVELKQSLGEAVQKAGIPWT